MCSRHARGRCLLCGGRGLGEEINGRRSVWFSGKHSEYSPCMSPELSSDDGGDSDVDYDNYEVQQS